VAFALCRTGHRSAWRTYRALAQNIQTSAMRRVRIRSAGASSAANGDIPKFCSSCGKSLWSLCVPKNPLNFGDVSKGMFNGGICEFESYNPGQPVQSLWAMSCSQEFVRHSRELCRRWRVSVPLFSLFQYPSPSFAPQSLVANFQCRFRGVRDSVRSRMRPV